MISYDSNEFKSKLIETLDFTIKFLERHGLRYYAYAGTLLGAVRHKGIIPWDDDIDILVPRDDYTKLISLSDELSNTKYRLLTPHNKGYYEMFAKMCDMQTTILESEGGTYPIGIFVDIFPLDYFDNTDEEICQKQESCLNLIHKYKSSMVDGSLKKVLASLMYNNIKQFKKLMAAFVRSRKSEKYLQDFFEFENALNKKKGSKAICLYASPYKGKIYKSEWFEETISCPFENIFINIPSGFDEFLTLLFGDYMTPPPPNKRINHRYYFVDVQKSLNVDEIRKIVQFEKSF